MVLAAYIGARHRPLLTATLDCYALLPKERRLSPGVPPDSDLSTPFTPTPLQSRIANGPATSLLRFAPFHSLKFGDRHAGC